MELLRFWTSSIVGFSLEYREMEKIQKLGNLE
jgi:hypothetical protein